MGWSSFRIARLGGFEVRLDLTWFVMAFLFAVQVWTVFQNDPARAIWFSTFTVALFFASVLVHELAHAAAFRAHGIGVRDVTLWMLGGFTRPAEEPRTAVADLLISAAGPVASAAVGLGLLLAAPAAGDGVTSQLLRYWGKLNLWLAVLNALPGFPLDGGHVVRAALWRLTGDKATATISAARIGQAMGAVLIAAAFFPSLTFGLFSGTGLALIGIFMVATASAVASDATRSRAMARRTARTAMSPAPPAIPADLPATAALGPYLQGHEGEAFPVVAAGRVVGLLTPAMARAAAPGALAGDVATAQHPVVQVAPDEPMSEVVERLRTAGAVAALVVEDGRVIGAIEPADVARARTRR